jgi:Protein of unknown function (DUF3224)
MKATGTFKPTQWDEKTYDQIAADKKLTKATVELAFTGEIEGTANVVWLMFYKHSDEKDQHNASATFMGLMRFDGTLNGKSGTFIMDDRGTFENGALIGSLQILPESGTDELVGITGTAKYNSNSTGVAFEMEYELSAV